LEVSISYKDFLKIKKLKLHPLTYLQLGTLILTPTISFHPLTHTHTQRAMS
jgi:hypothetical protein